jgi:hypothetical protein
MCGGYYLGQLARGPWCGCLAGYSLKNQIRHPAAASTPATRVPIFRIMLRSKRACLRPLDVPLPARNRALHYLAHEPRLSDELRRQLAEVVNGYVGPCDASEARKGIEWMRERYRAVGQTPRF